MESFGTLLTGSIKTLIVVRQFDEAHFREVNLAILGENWETEGEWVPESEFPRFEELKEKRKWAWNGNLLYGRLERVV
jgi:hypothetical protein